MHNRSYYIIRGIVRTIFWAAVGIAALAVTQLVILAAWSLQF